MDRDLGPLREWARGNHHRQPVCHPDGVYQAPGGSEEDAADGFSFDGW
jgi:hypothetical protein